MTKRTGSLNMKLSKIMPSRSKHGPGAEKGLISIYQGLTCLNLV
uniref:Uncharacterized protein n=1 Tax=Arundo donax TaxID=35708 RepID=A0A0A9GML0_ARUDO